MNKASIAAAILAGAVALSPAPCRAYDSITLAASAIAGVILSPPGTSLAYGYSAPAGYGPRWGYPAYGGYANVGAPAAPAARSSKAANSGFSAFADEQPSARDTTSALPSLYKGDGCHWTKRGGRAVRVCD